jgi:glutamate racemase
MDAPVDAPVDAPAPTGPEPDERLHRIGVFDSGLGGLTVVRALRAELPAERIVYLGDTARVPYGTKSAATVARYSLMSARFLLQRNIKLLAVACNTASAFALDELSGLGVPVLGAVEPGADEAVAATRSGRIGVIGTLGTVRSGSYPRAIAARDAHARVTAQACPLFVPLVEEGWLGDGPPDAPEARAAVACAERYLGALRERDPNIDVIVLGCTHYPLLHALLASTAARLFGRAVTLVDSARAMARATRREMLRLGLLHGGRPAADEQAIDCFVTDETRFAELGARFLGHPLERVERVDLA